MLKVMLKLSKSYTQPKSNLLCIDNLLHHITSRALIKRKIIDFHVKSFEVKSAIILYRKLISFDADLIVLNSRIFIRSNQRSNNAWRFSYTKISWIYRVTPEKISKIKIKTYWWEVFKWMKLVHFIFFLGFFPFFCQSSLC